VPAPLLKENRLLLDTLDTFAGFIKSDGTYKVYTQSPDYYYLQAFSNNFLPGYYNDEGNSSVFWQNADSVLINNNIIDKNISLIRDSSFGNGSIGGAILFSGASDQQDYEGITLLARDINNNALYSYNFGKSEGDFRVTNIPYGTYELVAQKVGLDNAVSQIVTIDPFNNQITGINLNFIFSDVQSETKIPDGYVLYQNYPNPFNPITNINFSIASESFVLLKVYDILGKELATLVSDNLKVGNYKVTFDGAKFTSGVYFYRLQAGEFSNVRKMIFIK
jgi:hypothetical protein